MYLCRVADTSRNYCATLVIIPKSGKIFCFGFIPISFLGSARGKVSSLPPLGMPPVLAASKKGIRNDP